MLAHWTKWHSPDEGDEVEAPDIDYMLHRQQQLEARGIGRVLH